MFIKKKMITASIILILLSSTSAFATRTDSAKCFVVGYAYSYDSKEYYSTGIDTYTYAGDYCHNHRSSLVHEWREFFNSKIKDDYDFTKEVIESCGNCPVGGWVQSPEDAWDEVLREWRQQANKFYDEGFETINLNGFDVRDGRFNYWD